ncbi:hypothetical protein PC129_g15906 [Phytophthora cactorum]|uniref:ZSWIM1/3 RNaseH-like domain-containing protein n=1 Tax=Phytophthora cactorum TaxID=29920 RepID=A0A329RM27_9STRA|nr:hypothetical protein PC112_g17438 [Phytophthora cactorum]KAG2811567.1 hypothetical protein PC111_g15192 [Phytophthora cactorum]KAG2898495.1 hypothetical protein PC115_g16834 [Phytophthora cactorum]KAG2969949.1 hypothetical protein PC118_g17156 [Phytophthora cactorum]KAG2993653.1 hypothetical protein PC119_g18410 [Phytophthora cactorum]
MSDVELTLTDVFNKIAKIKDSDENQVAELLVKFDLAAPGIVSAAGEDTHGDTAVVTISSEHMGKLYKRLPEILLVDCMHKTNRYKYQLCALMIVDQFGNGQAVQHSVIERDADWHMMEVVDQFQRVNDWERTKLIMVDKDLNEIEVLRSMFSDARILLCHLHVLK